MDSDNYLLSSVYNTLCLLEIIGMHGSLSLTELSAISGQSKTSCFRSLYTLEKAGYVIKDDSAKYTLSLKILRLGTKVVCDLDLVKTCKPYMRKLRDHFNEAVHLVVLDEYGNGIFIHKEASSHLFQTMSQVGFSRHAYLLATGKVLLSHLPDDELQKLVNAYPYTKLTPNSISSGEELLKQLSVIRTNGYAEDNEESELGLSCLAAPVFDLTGKCVASISVSARTGFIHENRADILKELISTCNICSKSLGAQIE